MQGEDVDDMLLLVVRLSREPKKFSLALRLIPAIFPKTYGIERGSVSYTIVRRVVRYCKGTTYRSSFVLMSS